MTTKRKTDKYLSRLEELYSNVKNWLPKDFTVEKEGIELNEELSGQYIAPGLKILDTSKKVVAKLCPVGASVIGAEGLVELTGKFDRQRFVFLEAGGPTISVTEIVGEKKTKVQKPLFKNVTKAGWYWIEDSRRSKAAFVDKEVFTDLISEVSNYAF
jgi:hypothetical protein